MVFYSKILLWSKQTFVKTTHYSLVAALFRGLCGGSHLCLWSGPVSCKSSFKFYERRTKVCQRETKDSCRDLVKAAGGEELNGASEIAKVHYVGNLVIELHAVALWRRWNWTGNGFRWRLTRGNIVKIDKCIFIWKASIPVQYWENEYDLLRYPMSSGQRCLTKAVYVSTL